MENQISHVKFLQSNARLYLADMSKNEAQQVFGISRSVYAKVMGGNVEMLNLTTACRLAEMLGQGISELFINTDYVDKYHSWYAETDAKYFAKNLLDCMTAATLSKNQLAKLAGIDRHLINRCLKQQTTDSRSLLPRLVTLQKLADALQVEVADLFLP